MRKREWLEAATEVAHQTVSVRIKLKWSPAET